MEFMPAVEVVDRVRTALNSLNRADLKDPRLMEVLNLSEQLVEAMQAFFGSLDESGYGEFRYIATYIARTRQEISALRPNDISAERIPSAGAELEAIVRHTESATHAIMEAAEAIMVADTSDPESFKSVVDEKVMEIFQACSFQDITGQRVQKIVDTLKHIEAREDRFGKVMGVQDAECEEVDPKEARKRAQLLNGPALNGPEVKQDVIDSLFADAGAPADQDAIDKLFA
jgi:chemotaxis protein CheZ